MRNYDLTVFYDSSNGENAAKELETKLETTITKNGGKIYSKEHLGKVTLAGTFKHHAQAYGTRFQYAADNKCLAALEKEYQINEGIIRQLNTRLESVLSEEKLADLVK